MVVPAMVRQARSVAATNSPRGILGGVGSCAPLAQRKFAHQCIIQTMNTSPHNLRWQKRIARKQKLRDRAMKGEEGQAICFECQ
jgi:hypothetical protein